MAQDKKVEQITNMEADFAQWYPDICRTAALRRQEGAFLDCLAADYLAAAGLTAGRQRLRSAPEVLRQRALRQLAGRLPGGKED